MTRDTDNNQKPESMTKRNPNYPAKKKKIMDRISELPTPLKVVVWLNIVLAVITIIESVAYITSVPASTDAENGFNVLLSVLIIVGILQASRLIRIIVLVCSWIAAIMIGAGIVFLLLQAGLQAILAVIPFAVSVINIWGLSTARSKAYFGY